MRKHLFLIVMFIIYLWSFTIMDNSDSIRSDPVVYDYTITNSTVDNGTINIKVDMINPHLNPSPIYWLFALSRAMFIGTVGYIIGRMKIDKNENLNL